MSDTLSDIQEKEIRQWCSAVAASFDPGKTLFLGQFSDAVVRELSAANVSASVNTADSGWDTLLLDQSGLEECLGMPPDAFHKRFGIPRQVLFIASTIQSGPSLPEAARWLWSLGYLHDFAAEVWADQRTFISAYTCADGDMPSAIETYEAEWWRQAQISQKRRALLVEYMDELVNSLLGFYLAGKPSGEDDSEYKRRLTEAGYRWEAFQNSRTGKVLALLQKIRRLGRS